MSRTGKDFNYVPVHAAVDDEGRGVLLNLDAQGRLRVIASGGSSGGTSAVDESAFNLGVDSLTPSGGIYDDAAVALSTGETGAERMTAYRAVHANLRDATGAELGVLANPLQIAGSLSIAPVTSSTASTPSRQTIGTTASTALAANPARLRLTLQNVGTTILYIAFGATPTTTNFHLALPAGGATGDGSSPIYADVMWLGDIQAISSASGGLLQVGEFTA